MKALQLTEWKHEPEFREVEEPGDANEEIIALPSGSGADVVLEVISMARRGELHAEISRFDLGHAVDASHELAAGDVTARAVIVAN